MKDKLEQIESHLQSFIEKNATRLFRSPDAESRLVAQLIQAVQDQIRTNPDGTISAPNNFSLNVPSSYAADIRANQMLLDTLAASLLRAGEQAGLIFEAHPTINVFPNDDLEEGQFSVKAMWKEAKLAETQSTDIDLELDPKANLPPKAFLIVAGSTIFTLENDVINIGRKLNNHLVIDEPRVSRQHCQLRAVKGRYMLFDLKSSGGTYVNGERIAQIALHPGDVISLAGIPVVYGQDSSIMIDETQEYKRPEITSDSGSTTVQINPFNSDTPQG